MTYRTTCPCKGLLSCELLAASPAAAGILPNVHTNLHDWNSAQTAGASHPYTDNSSLMIIQTKCVKWQKIIARTCQTKARYWVWKGERKTAKFLMMTFAYCFTYYLFYSLHIPRVDAFLKRGPSNLNNIYHAYIYINLIISILTC